ncbi:ABC transporter ATP-binding protein [Thermovibrio sp.]
MVEVRELSYGVLKGISFKARRGDVVGVVGRNGSGKTTLLRCLGGFYPYKGEVLVKGKEVRSYPLSERIKLINYLPQSLELPLPYTVGELLYLTTGKGEFKEELEFFKVRELLNREFNLLSGGEKVKVLLTRLLILEPEVLLLDEPSAFLDLCVLSDLLLFIKELSKREKVLFIVSHDFNFLFKVANRFLALNSGKLYPFESKRALLSSLRELFGCDLELF